jgi:hypothetical protein
MNNSKVLGKFMSMTTTRIDNSNTLDLLGLEPLNTRKTGLQATSLSMEQHDEEGIYRDGANLEIGDTRRVVHMIDMIEDKCRLPTLETSVPEECKYYFT